LLLREVEKRTGIIAGCFRDRRVGAKAEHLEKDSNPRFVGASLSPEWWEARQLYEDLDCALGEMENRIKEQLMLFADRTSRPFCAATRYGFTFGFVNLVWPHRCC